MTMDLISGMAIIVSVFMLACALLALAARPRGESATVEGSSITMRALATIVVVFFITTADLLLIAQQVSLALGTFVVGVLVVVLLYVEPAVRAGKSAPPAKEDWRR